MRKKILPILFFTATFFISIYEIKAAGPPGKPMGPPPCWPPPCNIPLDGGLSFLIAAGVVLAGKKINGSRKKSV